MSDPASRTTPPSEKSSGITALLRLEGWNAQVFEQLLARQERMQILEGRGHHAPVRQLPRAQFRLELLVGIEHDFTEKRAVGGERLLDGGSEIFSLRDPGGEPVSRREGGHRRERQAAARSFADETAEEASLAHPHGQIPGVVQNENLQRQVMMNDRLQLLHVQL